MNPGSKVAHYTVVEHLGSGGMGAVYRATDAALGREVALKVLPPSVATDPARLERFRREARAVAALNHPNIVTIYSVEHADGLQFLTMELVTGEALDRVIGRGPVPIERIVDISQSIADALAAAHERGVVHRDLKPANVMVTSSGRVKVLDFGLAKMQADDPASGAEAPTGLATSAGAILGTPAYMSPEQVSGVDIDHRTDVFSLGVLLYELATGVRPFRGQSPGELASSILRDQPRPASEVRSSVPAHLSSVIAKCLEKDRRTRYASMRDVLAALRPGAGEPAASPELPSVAVLPFQNLSQDPQNEFFGDGLAEEILNALSQVEGLRVAARTSSFSFKGRSADVGEIGSKLHVRTVLDGSVRRSGNRVRVTVQLVEVATGYQLWSERYDREMSDIFDVQDEIARAVAERFKIALTAEQSGRLVKQATRSVEAYDLYLRGRALLLRRGRHVAEGIECLRRAVDLDPAFAGAWSGLADSYSVRGYWGMDVPGVVMPKALTAARRATALDPDLAEAHASLGMALLLWERNYPAADAEFERAIALNPNYMQGRCWHGAFNLLWAQGRIAEGVAEVRRALEQDPLSGYATALLAFCLLCAGQNDESLVMARRGVERDRESLFTQWMLQMAAHHAGFEEESMAAGQTAEAVSNGHDYPIAHAAAALADFGRPGDARIAYARLLENASKRYVAPAALGLAASAVGEQDQALEYCQQACDERDGSLFILCRFHPSFGRLRADPRFEDSIRRLGLRVRP